MDKLRAATGLLVSTDSLQTILTEAERELASVEARLSQLVDRATRVASLAAEEHSQLQRFIEVFALEQSIYHQPLEASPGGTGPLIDIAALRRGAQELSGDLLRSNAVRANLETALHAVRGCKDLLTGERAFQPASAAEDLGVQYAMNAAREDERRRLAREVHDGPAQVLANAIFAIDLAQQVARHTPEQVPDELGRVRGLLRDGVTEIRRFMFDLHPSMLEDRGLVLTLQNFIDEYNKFFAMQVSFDAGSDLPRLSKDQDLTFFRIVQEALQNIRKHAQTPVVEITLESTGSEIRLSIRDRGKGFDPAAVVSRPGAGAGLPGMRERARLIGAEFPVKSVRNEGTTLTLILPLRVTGGAVESQTTEENRGGPP
ncbi:MAG: sensor histidine kinase [Chloroflexota bacterium]|nr:sensor histidine kinase [Chloroflexota bacterium]